MTTPCKLVSKIGSFDENQSRRVSRLVGELFEECSLNAQDYVNQKTIKIRTLLVTAHVLGFPWEKFLDLIYTNTRIHPEVANRLCRLEPHQENVEELLAQDFVPNDKLSKLLKRLSNHHLSELDHIAAVDGLASVTPNKRYDCKRYLENLCYSWKADDTGIVTPLEEEGPTVKRNHVHLVRRLYEKLGIHVPIGERVAPYVFTVLRECIKSVTGTELLAEDKTLPPEVLEELKGVYLSGMGEENLRQLVKELKVVKQTEKLDTRKAEIAKEGGGSKSSKKRKVDAITVAKAATTA